MKRILLDEKDFENLIRGAIITKDGVDIALSDIGFHEMIQIIKNNMLGENI